MQTAHTEHTHRIGAQYKRGQSPNEHRSVLTALTAPTDTTPICKMTAALCVCVLLAVLCTSCLGLPFSTPPHEQGRRSVSAPAKAHPETDMHTFEEPHSRHKRSVSQLKSLPATEEEDDSRANLSELLARIISSRKGSVRRNSTANSRSSALSANHRIADRDYLGWMDFGRRSAEEYEYPS